MIKVIIAGTAGRMGSRLVALMEESAALTLVAAVEKKGHVAVGEDAGELAGCSSNLVIIGDDLSACVERGDVIIDFPLPRWTSSGRWPSNFPACSRPT
jgi:4-hydroxy-tetrahydrodipicolinate reductase